jgi:hypothetical protein
MCNFRLCNSFKQARQRFLLSERLFLGSFPIAWAVWEIRPVRCGSGKAIPLEGLWWSSPAAGACLTFASHAAIIRIWQAMGATHAWQHVLRTGHFPESLVE